MRKWMFLLFAAAAMLLAFAASVSAAAKTPTPQLVLDGKVLTPKEPPALIGNFSMVPFRSVAESLGYAVDYNHEKKRVTIRSGARTIEMTVNDKTALVDGVAQTMPTAATLVNNTTFVPLRFVSETMGLDVFWDNATKSAFLYTVADAPDAGDGGTDPAPGDGGLIGVVDEDDEGEPTAPDEPPGLPPEEEAPEEPAEPTAVLKQIRFNNQSLFVRYEGTVTVKSEVLTNPDRIVIDYPTAVLAEDFHALPQDGVTPGVEGELPITGHESLLRVRYSMYEGHPRIVLDLNQAWNFDVLKNDSAGEMAIRLTGPYVPPDPGTKIVVLDAGHGGSDPGAKSVTGRWEKEFNLAVVLKVQKLLAQESGIQLVLTRDADTYPTLDDRFNLANSLGADLFVSVHANSNDNPSITGTETYYTREESKALADVMHQRLVAATGLKDRGVRTAGFKVIKYTTMPAVLLEVGYLSNSGDAKKLYEEEFQNRVAEAIAAGIKAYAGV